MLKKKFNFKKELNSLFNKLNIKKGSNIMLHSNAAGISQYTLLKKNRKKFYKIFFNSLLKKIGRGGTLVIPTYNYDFLKGKPFIYEDYNSQVGELGNFFLKEYKAQRSLDPVFSHAIVGNLKKELLNSKIDTCFGNQSIFNKLYDYNFKIFGFCSPLTSMTFLHYIEKNMNVNYRYYKKVVSTFIKNNKKNKIELKYLAGKKNINYSVKIHNLEKAFKNTKKLILSDFGNFFCWVIGTHDCFKIIKKKILKQHKYLII